MDDNVHKPDPNEAPLVSGRLAYSTSQAVEAMKHGKPGDAFTRDEMAAKIGRSCATGSLGYGNVNSAIRHVETQYGVVWRWSKADQAWVCLDGRQCVGESHSLISAARKRVRRSLSVAKTVDKEELDADTRREHNLNVAVTGMMMAGSSSQFRTRLGALPRLTQPETSRVLALFEGTPEKDQG